jgi:hypothetical protein
MTQTHILGGRNRSAINEGHAQMQPASRTHHSGVQFGEWQHQIRIEVWL